MTFGDVCEGWTVEGWIEELRRKADRCDERHQKIADYYRRWADALERTDDG